MPDEVYVFEQVAKAEIPTEAADFNTILEFGLLSWCLKASSTVLLFILSLAANSLCEKWKK